MTDSALDELAKLQGVGSAYHDYRGEWRQFSAASKAAVLHAMDFATDDAAEVATALLSERRACWQKLLPPVCVQTQGQPICCELRVAAADAGCIVSWQVMCEDGSSLGGAARLEELETVEHATLDGHEYRKLRLVLSDLIPLGYHQLMVALHTGKAQSSVLIVAPARCYESAELAQGRRYWGLALQLYTLRSARNWGIGDFGDLREVIDRAAEQQCAVLGLNPLHALRPADPEHISPYSPSSRQFFNVLYIDVPCVPEFAECGPARRYVASERVQERIRDLRATNNVDYVGISELKLTVLKLLHTQFRKQHLDKETERGAAFRTFVARSGEALRLQALYDALDRRFSRRTETNWGWQSWPEAYRDPRAAASQRFLREHADEVEFFEYLQWLADAQLAELQVHAKARGMHLGLYSDVAVGVNPNGAESWANQRLYLNAVSIGAPPDALALKGQDWGIPPQNPRELGLQAYAPFIDMLRANMRNAGALRIDHVMALCRLWWVPRGFEATDGVYMRYPLDDLMAIVALESVRNRCVVIGEDLGTVPDEMRVAMERYGLYHYKVLLFEKHKDGQFKTPAQYVRHALATVTTHDLPPLKSWWEGQDIELRTQLHLYPDAHTLATVKDERESDRHALMRALVGAGLWHWRAEEPLPEYSHALMRAVHLYLGLTDTALLVVQLEELLGMSDPVNVPGTSHEHPNWQRKLSDSVEAVFARADVQEMLHALSRARRGENPNQ